jgi:hypothetical protein
VGVDIAVAVAVGASVALGGGIGAKSAQPVSSKMHPMKKILTHLINFTSDEARCLLWVHAANVQIHND